jgi:Fur family ferric uptake transcriptional regulator
MTHNATPLPDSLRRAGLRVTAPRLAVLASVQGDGQHRDVEAIANAARKQIGSLSTQAVYDNLYVLEQAGLVRRIQPSGHPARFEARVGDNHHHIVCRRCGLTADVDCAVGAAPCLEPSAGHGFIVHEAEVTFWGLCARCQHETDTKLEIRATSPLQDEG